MSIQAHDDAYNLGYNAYNNGMSFSDNPYSYTDELGLYYSWRSGYHDAKDYDKRNNVDLFVD